MNELRKAILKEREIFKVGRSNSHPPEFPSSDRAIPTASFLISFNLDTPTKPNGKCPPTQQGCAYYEGKHMALECTVVRDPIRRHTIIQEARVCFNCLGRHRVTECKSRKLCGVCPGDSQPALPLPEAGNAVTKQGTEGMPTVPSVATFHTVQTNDTHPKSTLLKPTISPIKHHGKAGSAHILFDGYNDLSLQVTWPDGYT